MGIRLMELKIDANDRHNYILNESVCEEIIIWECLPILEDVKKYIETHPYPEDKVYSKEEFLFNVERATGYILLSVEKTETAEYIQELIYELI